MKILFASRRPVYPLFQGGAEHSFYELGRALAEAGHRVAMLGEYRGMGRAADELFASCQGLDSRWYTQLVEIAGTQAPRRQVLALRTQERLEVLHSFAAGFQDVVSDTIRDFAPDVVCTQLESSLEVAQSCRAADVRLLHFVRDVYYCHNFHLLVPVPGSPPVPACIANSHFTADFVRAETGVDAKVLYPIVRPPVASVAVSVEASVDRRDAGPRVLFVNPQPMKGGNLMHEVAAGGTPVMASNHSGPAEVLAGSAWLVDDFRSALAWAEAIRSALSAPDRQAQLADSGRRNAARFEPIPIREEFERLVDVLEPTD